MIEQLLPTVVYCILYGIIFYYLYKHNVGAHTLYIVGLWFASSVFAVVFQILFDGYYYNLSLLPYLYIILCFLVTLNPIIKEGEWLKKNIPILESSIWDYIIWGFIIVSIIPFYENLSYVISSYGATDTSGLADVYDDKMYGDGIRVTWLSSIGKIGNSLDGIFINFLVFSPFYFLIRPNIKKTFLVLSFLPLANHALFQLATSGRGFVTQLLLLGVFFYLLFRDRFSLARLRTFKIIGAMIIGGFIFVISVLTIARRDATNSGVDTSIVIGYYVAKSHLDFNQDLWNIKKNTEGDNSFGYVKDMLGFDVPTDKNQYWSYDKTGVFPNWFYTYIGDWYMDFGAIITFLFFCIFAKCFGYVFARSTLSPSIFSIFCYFIYCDIIINGWTINIFKTPIGFRNLLLSIVLIFFINRTTKIINYKNI